MLELCKGNILEANAEALVNTVNTKGIMGKGIALQFKKAFPEVFVAYKKACDNGEIKIGQVNIYERLATTGPRFIINFPTKDDWKKPSKNDYIEKGLISLIKIIQDYNIHSIAMPALGCGLGGLSWDNVFPLIKAAFDEIPDVKLLLYPPVGVPKASDMPNMTIRPKMTPARAVVLQLLKQYCVLGYDLTLLEAQKLLYFLQEAGEPLKLRFVKYTYGPYADNLRHVLSLFEGHFTLGFGDGLNRPDTPIKILPGALEEAEAYLSEHYAEIDICKTRLDSVRKLIVGFESPHGLELLSTVHWLVKHESISPCDSEEIVNKIQSWSQRKKRMMKPEHIQIAIQRLKQEEWI